MPASPLEVTVTATHQALTDRVREATSGTRARGRPRDTYARTDAFMGATSRHLAAVDDVVVPLVRRRVEGGGDLVVDYLQRARRLERALALLNARLYGEAHAIHVSWPRVWREVSTALDRHNESERQLVAALLPVLDGEEHTTLAERVYRAELAAPTRPHPFLPHQGLSGRLARRLWSRADRFWDAAQGRMVPDPVAPPSRAHAHDSLMAQYLMGEPHFDGTATVLQHRERR